MISLPSSGIRARLVALIALSVSPAFAAVIYSGFEDRHQGVEAAREGALRHVHLAADRQRQVIESAEQLLSALVLASAVQNAEPKTCSEMFSGLLRQYPQYANIGAVDTQGDLFASGVAYSGRFSVATMPVFQRAMRTRRFTIGDYQAGELVQRPVLILAKPAEKRGAVSAVVFASLDLNWVYRFAEEAGLPEGSVVTVVNSRGVVLARSLSPNEWVGRSVADSEIAKVVFERREGFAEASGFDGVRRLFAFSALPGFGEELGAFVWAGIPSQTIVSRANGLLERNLTMLGLGAVIVFFVTWYASEHGFMRVTRSLVQAAGKLESGDLTARAKVEWGPTEFLRVASAFDRMAESLEGRQAERDLAESLLAQSEKKFSTIFQLSPDAISLTRLADAVVLDLNDAFETQTGYSREEVIGKPAREVVPIFSREDRDRIVAELRETGEIVNFEAELRGKGLPLKLVLISGRMVEIDGEPNALVISKDVSELKRAERALIESEARFRALAEMSPSAIVMYKDDRFAYVNPAMEVMSGYRRDELTEMPVWDIMHPESRAMVQEARRRRMAGEDLPIRTELKLLTKAGEERWVDSAGAAVGFGGETVVIGTAFDITDRKRAEEALRESEHNYRTLVEQASDGIFIADPDGNYVDVNSVGCRMLGYSREEILAMHVGDVVDPADRVRVVPALGELRSGMALLSEWTFKRKDGSTFPGEVSATVLEDGRFQGILRDVTERKRAEEALRKSTTQLRALSAHVEFVREEERTRIAREVHDELGQALTGLKMDLAYLKRGLVGNAERQKLVDKAESMSGLIDDTIGCVRRIATELRPGVLDDLGLIAAIEWQANDFERRTGIRCKVSAQVEDFTLDRERSTAVFRIFQETLTNVARHAGATRVEVKLERIGDEIALAVNDNGRGIDESEVVGAGSLGLLGMHERASLIGGEFSVDGVPRGGTTVRVRFPMRDSRSQPVDAREVR